MPAELPALNAREPQWRHRAVQLARSHTPFAVTNFNAARDGNFYFAIRSKYQLTARIDYETARADFLPTADAPAPARARLKFRVSKAPSRPGLQVDFNGLGNADKPGTE
jgi:hypothetical protein